MTNTVKEARIPVLFRIWPNESKSVIAIFPTLPGTSDPATCLSFMHVGQHGSCDPKSLISRTRPAKCREYKYLYDELTTAPYSYRFDVEVRLTSAHHKERRAELVKAKALVVDAAENRRLAREARLAAFGFEEPSAEQRKANLALSVALREWPKD